MILERELQWGHEPGWFSRLDTEQQAAILALLKLEAEDTRKRIADQRHREMRRRARRGR